MVLDGGDEYWRPGCFFRFAEFSPSQMATFVAALSRLVKGPNDDGIVCDIVTQFSEYSSGNGTMARFPPEERRILEDFGAIWSIFVRS